MKKILVFGMLILVLVVSLAVGCAKPVSPLPTPAPAPPTPAPAPPTPAPAPPTPPAPKPEGELRIAFDAFGEEMLNPSLAAPQMKNFCDSVYDYIVGSDFSTGELNAEKGIAYKWEESPDKLSWAFYLRKGVKFHNGDELTAEDVKFTIDRVLAPEAKSTQSGELRATIEKVEVVDPYKVIVHLKKTAFLLPYYFAAVTANEGMIVPKRYIEEHGADYFAAHPIGSGPYKVVKQTYGVSIELEAVDEHWRVGVPKWKKLTFILVPEEVGRVGMVKRGEVDIAVISRDSIPEAKAAGLNLFYKRDASNILGEYLQQWVDTPLKDVRVRKALSMAINRQELLDTILRGAGKLSGDCSLVCSWALGYIPMHIPSYDPEGAKKLLTEAGYPDGFTVHGYFSPRPGFPEGLTVAEAVAGYWEQIGAHTELHIMDYATLRDHWMKQDMENPAIYMPFNQANRAMMDAHINMTVTSKGRLSIMRDSEMEFLNDKMLGTTDVESHNEMMGEILTRLDDLAVGFGLFYLDEVFVTTDKVKEWDAGKIAYAYNWEDIFTRR